MSQDETGSEGRQGRPDVRGMLWPLVLATQLGVTMGLMTVVTVLAGLFLGSWVDRQLGTRPVAALLFISMAVVVGFLGTINLAQSTTRRINSTSAQPQVRIRTAFLARDLGRAMLLVGELALVTLVPIGFALWLGLRLDRALGTGSLFTIALSVLSLAGALVAAFLIARRSGRARSAS